VAWDHCAARRCLSRGCPEAKEARRIFGCDGDGDPGYLLDCWRCYHHPDPGCPLCHGSGEVTYRDCPARLVTQGIVEMHEAYAHYREGLLPIMGGMRDQSRSFCEGVRLLAGMYSMHQEREMKAGKQR